MGAPRWPDSLHGGLRAPPKLPPTFGSPGVAARPSKFHGGPEMAPKTPTFGTPRPSRGVPLSMLAELIVTDVGGRQPCLAQQQAQARVHHRRRPRDPCAHTGEAACHPLAGHGVDEAARERKVGMRG